MNKRVFLRMSAIGILFISLITPLSSSRAQETADIRLKRTFGMAFGDTIQGTFTIIGTGTDNIVNLTLQFDGAQVAFEDDNSLTYRFKTKDYPPGELNITLIGYDFVGSSYSSTETSEYNDTYFKHYNYYSHNITGSICSFYQVWT